MKIIEKWAGKKSWKCLKGGKPKKKKLEREKESWKEKKEKRKLKKGELKATVRLLAILPCMSICHHEIKS